MCDTFRPLKLTPLARELDDPSYAPVVARTGQGDRGGLMIFASGRIERYEHG